MSPGLRKSRTLGAWLSLLAVYVQLALPMLIAVELRLAEAGGSGSAAFAICSAGAASTGAHHRGAAGAPGTGDDHSCHCCPLCAAIGASYIAPAEISLSAPATWTGVLLTVTGAVTVSYPRAATYDARAPPLNG
jgi:hypothetical protein